MNNKMHGLLTEKDEPMDVENGPVENDVSQSKDEKKENPDSSQEVCVLFHCNCLLRKSSSCPKSMG